MKKAVDCTLYWGPRLLCVAAGGYYGLGYAYGTGAMAALDRLAIQILKRQMGYLAVGALMPTFQWYAAWGVRIGCGLTAGAAYDLGCRIASSLPLVFCELDDLVRGALHFEPIPVDRFRIFKRL